MAKHEFGIFEAAPEPETSYDTYESKKYDCIAVDDAYIEPLLENWACWIHILTGSRVQPKDLSMPE